MGHARSAEVVGLHELSQSAGESVLPGSARSLGGLLIAAAILLIAAASLLSPAPARAARIHPLLVSETLPNEETPFSVDVNQLTHHFFGTSDGPVYQFEGESIARNFEPNGQIDATHPELTGAPSLSPWKLAVDNSGGPTQGYVYLIGLKKLTAEVVQQFNGDGEATSVQITEASVPANGTAQAGGLPPVVNKGTFFAQAIDVGTGGDVFVYEREAEAIDVFTPTGVFVSQLAAGVFPDPPRTIALDAADDIYLAFEGEHPGLYELNSSGGCVQLGCVPIDPAPISAVAVDNATGTVYAASESEGKFSEYESTTGKLLGVTDPKSLHSPWGIAVDEGSGNVIVADKLPERQGTLKIFGGVEEVPDVKTLTPEDVTDESATLKGEISASGLTGVTCIFQYIDQEGFEADGFEAAGEAPCEPGGPFSGAAPNAVRAHAGALRGGTTYHERIVGESNPGELGHGSNPGEDITFTTLGPTIAGTEAADVGPTTATLRGTVEPNGSATTYRFEYLTEAAYEANPPVDRWAGATEVPDGGAAIGSGAKGTVVQVSQTIAGLAPRTAYRLRIVAVSGEGTTDGVEVVFTAQASPSAGLPDGRHYEQVSPTDKNGANIQGALDAVQASLQGERITFLSNTGIPGGEGAQKFPTFMASRSATGWSTQGLLPPASYGPRAAVLGWDEELEDTYDFAGQPFEGGKLLRRQSSSNTLTQAGTIASTDNSFAYAGSSSGGEVALLETREGGLLPGEDLPGKQNVYVYGRDSEDLAVAGVLNPTTPGGKPTVPPGGAMAGPYDWFQNESTTAPGGAIALYYTQAGHAISADGTKVFFTAGGTGQLYVRLNPLAAQSAMSGEACTEAAKACTVRVSAPEIGVTDPAVAAVFVGASADGRLVYFLDKGKLTTNATGGSGRDLYRYDIATGELLDLSLDATDKAGARVEGMLAIGGPAGEDAYFVAAGQLAAGTTQAPPGETNLYALHGTTITFVTRLGNAEDEAIDWVPSAKFRATTDVVAHAARLSADGRTLLFSSARQLTSYPSHGKSELYLDAATGITCISCNPSGEAPAGSAGVQQIPPVTITVNRTSVFMTRNLSLDGKRVFFDSPDRLVSSDHNDVNDVYEWEAPVPGKADDSCTTGSSAYFPSSGGCLFLISGGAEGVGPSWFGDADESGENVFFFTAQPLVAQDKDELVDVYDARVGGGIAGQEEEPKPPCEGEAGCRGPGSTQPVSPNPSSSSFTGPGNSKPKTCGKGKVRKGGRCVAKHKSKKHKKHKKHKSKKHKKHKSKKKGSGPKGKSHHDKGKGGGR